MVDFITSNPGGLSRIAGNVGEMQASRLRSIRMQREESELDEAERMRRQREGIDAATREAVREHLSQPKTQVAETAPATQSSTPAMPMTSAQPQGVEVASAEPRITIRPPQQPQAQPSGLRRAVASRLATVQGGGQMAAQMAIASEDREHQVALKGFEIATSNPDAAETYFAQNGMPIPPGMRNLIHNRQIASYMKSMLDRATKLYPGEGQAKPRMQYFMQQLRGLDEGLKAQGGLPQEVATGQPFAGTMPEPVDRQQFAPYPITLTGPDGKPKVGVFDPNKTASQAITDTGMQGYGRGGGGVNSSATERVIEQLRIENPNLTYAEAVALAKKAPNTTGENLRRETLALNAAKQEIGFRTNPRGTLEKWRRYYGLSDEAPDYAGAQAAGGGPITPVTPPAPIAAPATSPPPAPQPQMQRGPDGRDYPMISSQGEYDALPQGSVYFHGGKQQFLRKGQ